MFHFRRAQTVMETPNKKKWNTGDAHSENSLYNISETTTQVDDARRRLAGDRGGNHDGFACSMDEDGLHQGFCTQFILHKGV